MEVVTATKNNLTSILMGKNIQFPWRGQQDVAIIVPYKEWLSFMQTYNSLFSYRRPLNYQRMLNSSEEVKVRYFFYDISWALYSELACSSNVGNNSTLILPSFDTGEIILMEDVIKAVDGMTAEEQSHWHSGLKSVTRNYFMLMENADLQYGLVDLSILSDWNTLIYKLCLYLQSRSSNKNVTKKLNIDWRSI